MTSDTDDKILHYLPLALLSHMPDSSTDDKSNCIREFNSESENNVVSRPVPLLTQRTSDTAGALLDMFINPTTIESYARDCGS